MEKLTPHFDAEENKRLNPLKMIHSSNSQYEDMIRAKRIADFMDSAIRVPGTNFRVGFDPILGLLPGVGDFISNAVGIYPISLALKNNLSHFIIARMIFNLAIDYVFGQIPLLGDLFDIFFKANHKNFKLLEKGLLNPRKEKRHSFIFMSVITLVLILILISPIVLLGLIISLLI